MRRAPYQLFSAALIVVGCQDAPPAPTAPSASASSSSDVPRATVTVVGDGSPVGVVLSGDVKLALADLLPKPMRDRTKWKWVGATARDGRQLGIQNWNGAYRGYRALLFLHEGKPTLGVFKIPDATNDSLSDDQARRTFGDVVKVEVRTDGPPARPVKEVSDRQSLSLDIGGHASNVAPEVLAKQPQITVAERTGVDLLALLKGMSDRPIASVVITSSSGERRLELAELEKARPLIRYSGRGHVVVELPDEKLQRVSSIAVP